ncbi:division plane positioning ATPase MipZ [Candidatus Sneabacter namystus]|uniref:AAA family ATPase n=1 Tax=Candidatus Sneabacter namystus TaxID=2601646 RepID=A0A5C0UJ78_9RICK|nr:division plane positioning ATPase MipZ [Candidatus Sneabacter namystus]QEK39837.1 AAA family ATPase [Candidatus Sneabacter namystus]
MTKNIEKQEHNAAPFSSSTNRKTHILVIGNIKGGAGKSTCAMHIIAGLIDQGLKVASLDTDGNQKTLTTYIQNRQIFNQKNSDIKLQLPLHFLLQGKSCNSSVTEEQEAKILQHTLNKAKEYADVIVIDTPGSVCSLSSLAHSYADTIVTPVNDSFLDIDVLASVNPDSLKINKLSTYSEMIWKQKLLKAQRDGGEINWVIVRNRLSSIDAKNKRAVSQVIEEISKKVKCRVSPGFGERVIFRELFLKGLTLLDLPAIKQDNLSMSHVAARQELRGLLRFLNISKNS